jgi:hypothetical protein
LADGGIEMTSRRTLLKRLAVAGALGPAGIAGLVREALANGANPVAPGLRKATGEVRLNGQPARVGMLVAAGDTITTGPGAEAIYVMGQDAFLQRDNSMVSFATDAGQQLMRVLSGKILSVFGKGDKRIVVSTATIGIRGTACYIEDEPAKVGADGTAPIAVPGAARTYFCLCYGTADLEPSAAPQERETYSTRHHDKPMYIHNDMQMPKMMVPAGIINHTDLELTLLENLVGRWPPFYATATSAY